MIGVAEAVAPRPWERMCPAIEIVGPGRPAEAARALDRLDGPLPARDDKPMAYTGRSGRPLSLVHRSSIVFPMDHDAAHKFIYALREVVADLLRLVVPDWVGELDLATLEDLSSEFFDAGHRKRVGDMAWRVRFREGTLANGERPYLLVLIEFQSTVDREMAQRVREYTELLRGRLLRNGAPEREGGLPWVLPLVVYNGRERWTAPGEASELAPLPSARAGRDLTPLQPQRYRRVDAGPRPADDWPADGWPVHNRVSATVRLQRHGGSPRALLSQLREEMERFSGARDESFRRALYAWAKALWADRTDDDSVFPSFEELEREKGGGDEMTTVFQANWMEWEAGVRAEERAQGIEKGRTEEGKRLLGRQVMLKFGVQTAERLSGLLEGLTARGDLDRVSDWIIECGTGEELLSRVSALHTPARTGPGGDGVN